MAKYMMTLKWVEKLAPDLKVSELTRIAYQQLLNDYAKEHERQTTLDFHHQLKGAILDAVDEGLIQESLGQIESEYDACLAVATKYLKNRKIDEKTKEKLYRHLLGRGFEYEVIGSVARKTLQNADIEE